MVFGRKKKKEEPLSIDTSLKDFGTLFSKEKWEQMSEDEEEEEDEEDYGSTIFDWSTPTDLALRQAASFVDDAQSNRREMHMIDPKSLQLYYLYHSRWVRYLLRAMMVLQVFINPLFETPQTIEVPLWLPAVAELLAVAVYIGTLLLRYSFLVPGSFNASRQIAAKNIAFVLCNILFITDIIMWFITYYSLGRGIRWSRILRPYIIVYYIKPIRLALYTNLKMLMNLVEIFILILCVILIYALIGYLVFLDTAEGELYMSSYWQSFLSFYILMTTANFPDVMMPAYTENHWTCLIFISFLLFVTYFLLNMVLALIFKNYSVLMRRKLSKIMVFERKRIYFAFALLDPSESNGISFNTWKRFIVSLRPSYSTAKAAFLFRLLNSSRTGNISVEEFISLLNVLQMDIYKSRKTPNIFERAIPSIYKTKVARFIGKFIKSKYFEVGMLLVVILNVILIVYQFISNRDCQLSVKEAELAFLVIFYLELISKILAYGPGRYFSHFFNIVDFCILAITTSDVIIALTSQAECRSLFLKFLFFAPILRLFRILTLSGFFKQLSGTILSVLPPISTYIGMQLLTFYVWVIIGMEIWAGEIYQGNPALAGTIFDAQGYYANSFNNFLYGYVTTFELMVVNNWQQIASGYVAISGQVAWLFFLSFNLWAVIIVVNWVVASIIESFQVHYELQQSKAQTKIEADIAELNEIFSKKLDFSWKAKYKKRFRAALQTIYNTEETEVYVTKKLGTPQEGTRTARSTLYQLVGGKEIYLPPSAIAATSGFVPDEWLYD